LQSLVCKITPLEAQKKNTNIVRQLKEKYLQLSSLRLPESKDNLIFQTYASDTTLVALLKIDLNEICSYHSGTFSEQEKNYNTI